MKLAERVNQRIANSKTIIGVERFLRKLILPGFDAMPLYDVLRFFIIGFMRGAVSLRASAISFNFFLALFPAILFFFTLIPYIPVEGFQDSLFGLMQDIIPKQSFSMVKETLYDIIKRPRSGLLSMGFILALYFATNGVSSIIEAFNQTYHTIETRSFFQQKLVSLVLMVFLSLLIVVAIILITIGPLVVDFIAEYGLFRDRFYLNLIIASKWIVLVFMFLAMFSLLYHFGPAKKLNFRFINAGSTLATLLTILTSIGFNYYVTNFSRYNTLYGSIGTLLVFLLWIYLNSIILLIGFELNASISRARRIQQNLVSRAPQPQPELQKQED